MAAASQRTMTAHASDEDRSGHDNESACAQSSKGRVASQAAVGLRYIHRAWSHAAIVQRSDGTDALAAGAGAASSLSRVSAVLAMPLPTDTRSAQPPLAPNNIFSVPEHRSATDTDVLVSLGCVEQQQQQQQQQSGWRDTLRTTASLDASIRKHGQHHSVTGNGHDSGGEDDDDDGETAEENDRRASTLDTLCGLDYWPSEDELDGEEDRIGGIYRVDGRHMPMSMRQRWDLLEQRPGIDADATNRTGHRSSTLVEDTDDNEGEHSSSHKSATLSALVRLDDAGRRMPLSRPYQPAKRTVMRERAERPFSLSQFPGTLNDPSQSSTAEERGSVEGDGDTDDWTMTSETSAGRDSQTNRTPRSRLELSDMETTSGARPTYFPPPPSRRRRTSSGLPDPPASPTSARSTATGASSQHSSFVWPRPMTWYRRVAYQPPYDPLFWVMWGCFTFIVVLFEAFVVRMLPHDIRMAFQIAFGGLGALLLAAMIYTTLVDTEDPVVRQARKSGVERDADYRMHRGAAVRDSHGQCRVCRVQTDESTRHCKLCNKSFCVTVIATVVALLMALALTCYLLAIASLDHDLFMQGAQFAFDDYSQPVTAFGSAFTAGVVLCCIQLFFTAIFLVPILHLFGFHIRLWFLGMTTSEYLTERRWSRERTSLTRRCLGRLRRRQPSNPWRADASSSSRLRDRIINLYLHIPQPRNLMRRFCSGARPERTTTPSPHAQSPQQMRPSFSSQLNLQ
ncbi:hypothetical protein THASP1DRAFT_23632 [Thamnocephalis sphaerospora]|uniref:Palmitoyltransferase n=1 Tax=Thamnocephalis sphaerospora TaxID=78915 RepID=A0A4P9XS56_9FUNG|nr:hypothetical protein THASP1DRAFT_23632 [Thamnocephalis sphaerospora]|eukprot:RKP08361.1 hypothetical protein THASP1DRAFT_23632 [Thamnocephalis sphaerospora]